MLAKGLKGFKQVRRPMTVAMKLRAANCNTAHFAGSRFTPARRNTVDIKAGPYFTTALTVV